MREFTQGWFIISGCVGQQLHQCRLGIGRLHPGLNEATCLSVPGDSGAHSSLRPGCRMAFPLLGTAASPCVPSPFPFLSTFSPGCQIISAHKIGGSDTAYATAPSPLV